MVGIFNHLTQVKVLIRTLPTLVRFMIRMHMLHPIQFTMLLAVILIMNHHFWKVKEFNEYSVINIWLYWFIWTELGINPNHILQKVRWEKKILTNSKYLECYLNKTIFYFQTLSVLNPFRTTDQMILQDTDLAGPLVFCLTLGSFLLLVSFFYIFELTLNR